MFRAFLKLSVFLSVVLVVSALSKQTRLKVINDLDVDIVNTEVQFIDKYDWDGEKYRPDTNFNGKIISAGDSAEEREEVDYWAKNCPIQIKFSMDDGTSDTLRWNQKYAIGEASLGLVEINVSGKHERLISRYNGNTLLIHFKKRS